MPENVIIMGGGPAGLTAAIYAARGGLSPLVIEGYQAGGQLMITTDVENFPGYPDGVMGPAMMQDFRRQADKFGARLITQDVTRVEFSKGGVTPSLHAVWVSSEKYETRALIIATGSSARWLGIPSEARLRGKGVSACATCDGAFFRNEVVTLVGGGDSAMEEAIFLTRFASEVKVIHRRDRLRASKIMQERAFANKKISFVWDSIPIEVLGEKEVTGLRVKNVKTEETQTIDCQGLFVAIGHDPNTVIFKGKIELDDIGYIVTRNGTETSVAGVFACGDVQDRRYRQAVTAAGSGCMAAIDAGRYLESLGSF